MQFKKLEAELLKQKLDEISPSICLEKWTGARIYLHSGHTHSCHHPKPHFIPVEEILKSPAALHNTAYKKEQRKLMLEGSRPKECDYCWAVEDSDATVISDRIILSSREPTRNHLNNIVASNWDVDYKPSFLEISFSNVCNFACSYCNPSASSKWFGEILASGPYPTSGNYNSIGGKKFLEKEDNPYVDAFWKWWPDIYAGLDTLRITGGEPLLSKHTYKLIDAIKENPNPNLNLSFNTNLGVDLQKFITAVSNLEVGTDIKKLRIHTSNEAVGSKAEYIRYGLNYQEWLSNIELLLESLPHVNLGIMATYNILAVSSFTEFLKDIKKLKDRYGSNRITTAIQYLRDPDFLDIRLLPNHWVSFLKETLNYLEDNFNEPEAVEKFKQVISYFNTEIDNKDQKLKDLNIFIQEHDRRRGLNFSSIFPEYLEIR